MELSAGVHYGIAAADYHDDPAPMPSLSAGIATQLISKSARHAKYAHRRLNPGSRVAAPSDEMVDGTILHALALGSGDERIVVVDCDDWKTKAAQEARKDAVAAGNVAVLARRMAGLHVVVEAMQEQIAEHADHALMFPPGQPEASLIWQGRDGIWCRCRPDWLPDDPTLPVYDLKFTSASASPQDWEKHTWQTYGLRAEWYLRGMEALRGVRPEAYRFAVTETKPPYGFCVFEATPDVSAWAAEQCDQAELQWSAAMESGIWRGYPRRTISVELPSWFLNKWENARSIEQIARRPDPARVEAVAKIAARHGAEFGGPLS